MLPLKTEERMLSNEESMLSNEESMFKILGGEYVMSEASMLCQRRVCYQSSFVQRMMLTCHDSPLIIIITHPL